MDKQTSKKHHYLPRHYLNGFVKDGLFFVYDKKNDTVFSSSPSSTFFENNLNTIKIGDNPPSVFLEDAYTKIENTSWKYFNSIAESSPQKPIDPLDKSFLYLFLLFLYWRLPKNIKYVQILAEDAFKGKGALDYFNLEGPIEVNLLSQMKETIKKDPSFAKSLKTLLPFAPFYKNKSWAEDLCKWKFLYSHDNKPWYFVSDSPIVTGGLYDQDPVRCLEEFMFAISGRILLISTNKKLQTQISSEFLIEYNTYLIHNAERFVAFHDKSFLQKIVEHYNTYKHHGQENYIRTYMLSKLHN